MKGGLEVILSSKDEMILISVESKEWKNKMYYNVNVEDSNGKILKFPIEATEIPKLQKYRPFVADFVVSQYNGQVRLTIVSVVF